MHNLLKKLIVWLNIFCLGTSMALAGEMSKAEQHFWKRLDKRLVKQAKKIGKHLRKKSSTEIQIYYHTFVKKNKLGKKYNVTETLIEVGNSTRDKYAYFASSNYQENFKTAVNQKIQVYGSFEKYLQTTGASKKAFFCRLKRGSLRAGGFVLIAAAIAGGITIGMAIPNILAGTAIAIRPWTAALMAGFAVGTPGGIFSFRGASKIKCPGE
jgi:hypothetical protein